MSSAPLRRREPSGAGHNRCQCRRSLVIGSGRQARSEGRLRAAAAPHRTSPRARSAGSSATAPPALPTPGVRTRRRRRVCGSSRSLIASTRSAKPTQLPGAAALPRLYDEDYAVLAFLDRVGLAPAGVIRRAVQPDRAPRSMADRLVKLYRHGLVARHQTGLREHAREDGKPPLLYSITRRGLQVAQERQPAPAISPKREWREIDQSRAEPLRARPPRRQLGDRVPPHRRRARDRPLAHAALRHRPLPRPPGRRRPEAPPDPRQRDPRPRRAGDHRPRAQDLQRGQTRPLTRAAGRDAEAHVRSPRGAGSDGPSVV